MFWKLRREGTDVRRRWTGCVGAARKRDKVCSCRLVSNGSGGSSSSRAEHSMKKWGGNMPRRTVSLLQVRREWRCRLE